MIITKIQWKFVEYRVHASVDSFDIAVPRKQIIVYRIRSIRLIGLSLLPRIRENLKEDGLSRIAHDGSLPESDSMLYDSNAQQVEKCRYLQLWLKISSDSVMSNWRQLAIDWMTKEINIIGRLNWDGVLDTPWRDTKWTQFVRDFFLHN